MDDKEFMKRVAFIYGTVITVLAVVIACVGSYKSHDYHMTTESHDYVYEEIFIMEDTPIESQMPTEVPLIRTSQYVNLTFEEMDMLQQIAMIEARGEDAKGQALVMMVVLNRSKKDNQSIREVIFREGQFSTYGFGTYIPNEENNKALAMILDGWDESNGALFFCADGYNGREPLFQYGGHYFSKGLSK